MLGPDIIRAVLGFAALVAISTSGFAWAGGALPYDPRLTSIAQLLAGVEPEYAPARRVTALDAWQVHYRTLAPQWKGLRSRRLDAIEAWRDRALGRDTARCWSQFYPFSGPDFMNAYLLFPRCDAYVFVGLESPGSLPELDRMADADLTRTLHEIRVALRDVIALNFYKTKNMAEQLATPHIDGVLPPLVASMGLIRVRIVAIETFSLTAVRPERKPTVHGVKVRFYHPDIGKPQVLYYLSADASNAGFEQAPELGAFLAALKPAMVLIKAGSYLLHRAYFSRLRDTVFKIAKLVVQDDTGIPYRLFRERRWIVRLYGDYTGPISLFSADTQPDLAFAYKNRAQMRGLPFEFGYKGFRGESNAMVAYTKNR